MVQRQLHRDPADPHILIHIYNNINIYIYNNIDIDINNNIIIINIYIYIYS